MTLIIGTANQHQVVLVSDRRLSRNGRLIDDESNKAAILICRDARLSVAFTGLAQAGNFRTRRWLLETLVKSAKPDFLMEPMIRRLCVCANREISSLPVKRKADKGLSIIMAGYNYDEDSPRCYFWLVSNFEGLGEGYPTLSEPEDEFKAHYYREKRPSDEPLGAVIPFGFTKAFTEEQKLSLKELIEKNRPGKAIVGKAVEILQTMASSPLSANVIGKQCTSIILPSDPNLRPEAQYHSNKVTAKIFAPSFVEARGGTFGAFTIDSPEFEFRDSYDRPVVARVPKVRRNSPCPCGSGKKYKRCHGRF